MKKVGVIKPQRNGNRRENGEEKDNLVGVGVFGKVLITSASLMMGVPFCRCGVQTVGGM